MGNLWRHQLVILAVGGVVLFTNLGGISLWDRDEPRNASCAREMLNRGDWIVPTFNGELRVHKPVLQYWLMMSAYKVFGVHEFAARFWSAVLGIGTALLTYHIGRLLFRAEVGFWAALFLMTGLMFSVVSRAATPDGPLVFSCTLALLLVVRGVVFSQKTDGGPLPRRWIDYALIYAAMGVAVLAKGPVGVVLPTVALVLYGLFALPRQTGGVARDSLASRWGHRFAILAPSRVWQVIWSLRPVTALVVVAAVALPWYALVGLRTDGRYLYEFLIEHNQGRFLKPMENHSGSIFYYVIAVAAGMFPASVFLGPALVQHVQRLRQAPPSRHGDLLLACWAGTFIVFFSIARTKLPNYVLPAYPAVALLLGAFADAFVRAAEIPQRRGFRVGMACLGLVGVGMLIGVPIASRIVLPGEALLGLIGVIPLAAAIAVSCLAARDARPQAMAVFTALTVLFTATFIAYGAWRVDRHKNDRPMMAQIREQVGSDPVRIASYRHFNSTYVFYAERQVDEIGNLDQLRHYLQSGQPTYLLVRDDEWENIADSLPADTRVVSRRPRFLRPGELILLYHGGDPAVAKRTVVDAEVRR